MRETREVRLGKRGEEKVLGCELDKLSLGKGEEKSFLLFAELLSHLFFSLSS